MHTVVCILLDLCQSHWFIPASKKVHLGRVEIHQSNDHPESESEQWTLAMRSPETIITEWHNLICDPVWCRHHKWHISQYDISATTKSLRFIIRYDSLRFVSHQLQPNRSNTPRIIYKSCNLPKLFKFTWMNYDIKSVSCKAANFIFSHCFFM